MSDEITKEAIVEASKELVKQGYRDLAKPSFQAIGGALGNISGIVYSVTLPFRIFNELIRNKAENLLRDLNKQLPNEKENLITPKELTAIPIIQKYLMCGDEDIDLRNLFANLLAKSMYKKTENEIHPAFVEILNQLSSDEAKILQYLAYNCMEVPTVAVNGRNKSKPSQFRPYLKHYSQLAELAKCEKKENALYYTENLIRHGILTPLNESLAGDEPYEWVKKDTLVQNLLTEAKNQNEEPEIVNNAMEVSMWGKKFFFACIYSIKELSKYKEEFLSKHENSIEIVESMRPKYF